MRKKQSFILLLMTLVTVIFLSATSVFAASEKVYDKAELFSASEKTALEEQTAALSEVVNLDIIIVTTNDNEGKTSTAYADDFYDNGEFGYGTDKDGMLLLINMADREVYISTCGKAIAYFTDDRIQSILDKVYIDLADEKYNDGAINFLNEVEKYVQAGVPTDQYTQDENAAETKEGISVKKILISLLISLAAGGIVVGIMAMNNKGKSTTSADTYLQKDSFNLLNQEDRHIDTKVTHVTINTNSGGSSGKSSTHSSSSGTSHGGGGRKF